jgi:hypothetical protein
MSVGGNPFLNRTSSPNGTGGRVPRRLRVHGLAPFFAEGALQCAVLIDRPALSAAWWDQGPGSVIPGAGSGSRGA